MAQPGVRSADGGPGNDTVAFVERGWTTGVEVSFVSGETASRTGGPTTTFRRFEAVRGTDVADLLIGGDDRQVLSGRGGDDTIDGGRGAANPPVRWLSESGCGLDFDLDEQIGHDES